MTVTGLLVIIVTLWLVFTACYPKTGLIGGAGVSAWLFWYFIHLTN